LAPTLNAMSPVDVAKWTKLEKREVEAEAYVERKPMQLCSLLLSLLLLLLVMMMMLIMLILLLKHIERVLKVGIAVYIFTISTKYRNKIQAIWRAILLLVQLPIFGLNLHFKNTLSQLRYFAL